VPWEEYQKSQPTTDKSTYDLFQGFQYAN